MEAAKNRFVKIDGSGCQASGTFVLSGQELAALSLRRVRMKLGHELFKFSEAVHDY